MAYLIYMSRDLNDVWFEGTAVGAAVDLAPGLNMASLPAHGPGLVYSSYDMLQDLGGEDTVKNINILIKRFDKWFELM